MFEKLENGIVMFESFTNFPVGSMGKTRLQIHCYHNFSPDFTHVEASKITTEFIAGRTSGPMRPTKRSEDFVDDLLVYSNSRRPFNHKLKLASSGNFAQTF